MRSVYLVGVMAMLAAVLTACGCGRKVSEGMEAARVAADAQDGRFTVKSEDGEEVKVDATQGGESGKVTITDEQGKTTTGEYGAQAVKEEDVGVAFYPGAEVEMGSNISATGGERERMATVSLKTSDGFDAVAKFYKDKYATGNTVLEQPNNLMITIRTGEGQGKMVMVSPQDEGGGTQIVITATSGE